MNNKTKKILEIIDYGIIAFKTICLVYLISESMLSYSSVAASIYLYYSIPFLCYTIIGMIRLLKRGIIKILLAEMGLNIFFIILINANQAFFLMLTIISYVITILVYQDKNRRDIFDPFKFQ
jgi:hypothetical protein